MYNRQTLTQFMGEEVADNNYIFMICNDSDDEPFFEGTDEELRKVWDAFKDSIVESWDGCGVVDDEGNEKRFHMGDTVRVRITEASSATLKGEVMSQQAAK